MRAALYNSHLRTLGGGEQHALAIAHWLLGRGHDVDLLARPGVTIDECEARLGVSLTGARVVEIDDDPIAAEKEATARSASYELFVNATYASGAPSEAERSAVLVYFPVGPGRRPDLPPAERDRWTATARSEPLGWIENDHGLYQPEDGGAWSDGRASYVVRLSRPGTAAVRVTLGSPRPRGVPKAVATFTLDGAGLASRTLPAKGAVRVEVALPAEGTRGHRHRFDVRTDRFNLAALGLGDDGRDLGAFIQRVELTCGNHPNDLVEYGWRLRWLESYDVVLANSSYTATWMRRFWGQDAGVLYPPVVPPSGRPSDERMPTIVTLGRFFEGSHSKKQLEMVDAFAALCDEGLEGWRFVVVGGVEEKGRHYLERVREAAADYPIDIVPDAPRAEVERVLGEASLFWQATGWREDPERHPERFEHFGIALVEAMGAGAVPVVLDGGAAHEVVRDGREGLLWSHETGPGPATRMLVQDETRRQTMSERARKRADDFSPTAFDRALAKHLRRLRA